MKAEGKEGKKQRQSQSCDACRVRKVKCEPMAVATDPSSSTTPKAEDGNSSVQSDPVSKDVDGQPAALRPPCKQCFQLGVECLYIYRPRKRGPPNLYLRRLSEAQKAGQSFPSEADFEAAKASSRAVAERKRGRGKGKEGHELEHIVEAERDGLNHGLDPQWTTAQGRIDGVTELPGASNSNGSGRSSFHSLHQHYDPRHHLLPENGNATVESFVRTPLPDNKSHLSDVGHSKYLGTNPEQTNHTAGTAGSEDPFTPSQFMILDPDLSFSTSPIHGKVSPAIPKYPSSHHHASDMQSYASGLPIEIPYEVRHRPSFTDDTSAQHTSLPTHGLSSLSAASFNSLCQQSSNPSMLSEISRNPIISPGNLERVGAYFTSPSEAGSAHGLGTSQYPHGTPSAPILPERLGSTPSSRIPLGLSLSENIDRELMLRHSATQSTTAVHGDASTGGTDIQVSLPIHTLTSKTLGEVGAPYLYDRAKDGIDRQKDGGLHDASPSNDLLGDSKNDLSVEEQRAAGHHPHRHPSFPTMNANPLEAIIARPLLHHIINLFFDYVYPLTPCLHKPTFIQDLARQREMEPGQGEWIALVLATVMSTLVQVPRAFVPLTRREVKDLAYRCHLAGRNWSLQGYKDFTVNAVIIRYFDAVYNYCRGEIATCHTSLCEAQALATVLRLHEEETYTYLNPIEREVRRRIFFLLFQADKSESVLAGRPIRLREEECYSLRLPEELDDDYITETRYLQQPEGMTSVITGFNASIRIHCLGGRAITKHKEDKRDPPTGVRLQRRLEEVSMMLDEVTNVMKDCPPQLRLKEGLDSRVQSPAGGWDVEAAAKLQAFFFDPQASREFARNAFLVQQANCFVTKACVTFVLLQYQNDLLHLKAASTLDSSLRPSNRFKQIGGLPLGGISASKKPEKESEDYVAASKESLYYDLLSILHSIPIQCIAVNGPSLVNCVRYVASGLLDTVQLKTEDNLDEEGGVARAQGYLIDFLSILSDIEKNYSLDDDE